MLQNQNIALIGKRAALIPYTKQHVSTYHNWMQDPALLEATASDRLTLEDEYEMQVKWATDTDKATFIILDREHVSPTGRPDHVEAMVGDVNLFLNRPEDPHAAELEVMIAESGSRRKGLAKEAVVLMMLWANSVLGINVFEVKIGDANAASLALFSRLGFQTCGHSDAFHETALTLNLCTDRARKALRSCITDYSTISLATFQI